MSKVDAFDPPPGAVCRFYSNDHAPPHFHVKARDGAWEVKILFLYKKDNMVRLKGGKPRQSDLNRLVDLAEEHRKALLDEWDRKVNGNA